MKKTIAAATFVLLGAGGAAIGAIPISGSDTLEDVTKFMLSQFPAQCNPGGTLTYIGGGTTTGETAMRNGTQSVAPMSRALGAGICAVAPARLPTTANLFFCLDGLAIVSNANVTPTKPLSSCQLASSTTVAGYTFTGWQDILKVLYAGVHNNASKDCNSAVRNALAADYNSIFQVACAGNGACAGKPIQHLWRRSDLSGTTDTFLALLGLPGVATAPFCNGFVGTAAAGNGDFADNDPIRRPCVGRGDLNPTATLPGSEQVCNRASATDATKNTLGLVLPVFVPESHVNLPAAQIFPTAFCTFGFFDYRDWPAALGLCPDGQDPANYAGTCLIPYENAAGGPNFACLNRQNNRGIYLEAINGDGRVHNLVLRRPDSQILRDAAPRNRRLVGSFYRIHTNRILANGCSVTCQEQSSTRQIGCLVSASPCSLGFAGLEAATIATNNCASALKVNNVEPSVGNIQNLVLGGTTYPISRKLYFNTTQFNSPIADPDQQAVLNCFKDPARAQQACEGGGFVRSPNPPTCEDFNESACPGAPANVNACL
jgi:ABC-type phosphate transport system substrate-binding protein